MLNLIFDGDSLKKIRRVSFDDQNGLILEGDGHSVFLTYDVADQIVAFQKEARVFVSQIEAERMIVELRPIVKGSMAVTVSDKTLLLRAISDFDRKIEFTQAQKKTIKMLYGKYIGEDKKIEDDCIPF